MHEARYEERVGSFHALSKISNLLESPPVYQPRSSLNSDFLGFYGGFITVITDSIIGH